MYNAVLKYKQLILNTTWINMYTFLNDYKFFLN